MFNRTKRGISGMKLHIYGMILSDFNICYTRDQ